jgi:hypothetical protein
MPCEEFMGDGLWKEKGNTMGASDATTVMLRIDDNLLFPFLLVNISCERLGHLCSTALVIRLMTDCINLNMPLIWAWLSDHCMSRLILTSTR